MFILPIEFVKLLLILHKDFLSYHNEISLLKSFLTHHKTVFDIAYVISIVHVILLYFISKKKTFLLKVIGNKYDVLLKKDL